MKRSDCYSAAATTGEPKVPDEFQAETLLAWSDRLMGFATCPAVVGMILKLDAMTRVVMPGGHRTLLLRVLEDPLERLLRAMPRLTPGLARTLIEHGWELSMEQRLACASYRNLKQAQEELDGLGVGADQAEAHLWLLEQQFLLLERQVHCSIGAGLAPPPGTWLEAHAGYRQGLRWFEGEGNAELLPYFADGFDPSLAYRRLVLTGIAAESLGARAGADVFVARLPGLAAQARIVGTDQGDKVADGWLLELDSDTPGRRADAAAPGREAWFLIPGPSFNGLLGSARPLDPS